MPTYRTLEPRLHVADFAASLAFYRDVLGFTVETVFPPQAPSFAILIRDRVALQLGGPGGKKDAATPATCTLYFDVRDVQGEHARLKELVPIAWGPEVFFYQRREFAVRDPDGHLIVLSGPTDDPVTCRE